MNITWTRLNDKVPTITVFCVCQSAAADAPLQILRKEYRQPKCLAMVKHYVLFVNGNTLLVNEIQFMDESETVFTVQGAECFDLISLLTTARLPECKHKSTQREKGNKDICQDSYTDNVQLGLCCLLVTRATAYRASLVSLQRAPLVLTSRC